MIFSTISVSSSPRDFKVKEEDNVEFSSFKKMQATPFGIRSNCVAFDHVMTCSSPWQDLL